MYEEYTEEYFLNLAIKAGQELGVDTRQGSVYMDAATGHCIRTAKFYNDLKISFEMLSIDKCGGEILDEKVAERGLYRKQAVPSFYKVVFEGVNTSELNGERFMTSGYYFVLEEHDGEYYLKSEEAGTQTNNIMEGESIIPLKNAPALLSATVGEIYSDGAEQETDESLRGRFKEFITETSENGNKQQYKTWCESFEGVGRAIIYPLSFGPNTVKAVIISSEGGVPGQSLITDIQEYIDPASEGLGEGVAPIGCHFTAVAASEKSISILFDGELVSGYNKDTVLQNAIESLHTHFKEISLNSTDVDKMLIRYVKIAAILANTDGIKDFSNLLVNSGTENISIGENEVAVLGEVDINVSV